MAEVDVGGGWVESDLDGDGAPLDLAKEVLFFDKVHRTAAK
jgi:hypothetical protein